MGYVQFDVAKLFRDLGLKPPRMVYATSTSTFFEEGFEINDRSESAPQRQCHCCECFIHIGPPGCDGENCRQCGDSRCGG